MSCLSATVLSSVLSSCGSTKFISGKLVKDGIIINKNDFEVKQRDRIHFNAYIIIRNESLNYPICVYRLNDNEYTALWMRCTHQGTELQVSGEVLQCSAHGSEFNNKGEVRNGPADTALRTFPLVVNDSEIFIDLRKQS